MFLRLPRASAQLAGWACWRPVRQTRSARGNHERVLGGWRRRRDGGEPRAARIGSQRPTFWRRRAGMELGAGAAREPPSCDASQARAVVWDRGQRGAQTTPAARWPQPQPQPPSPSRPAASASRSRTAGGGRAAAQVSSLSHARGSTGGLSSQSSGTANCFASSRSRRAGAGSQSAGRALPVSGRPAPACTNLRAAQHRTILQRPLRQTLGQRRLDPP